MISIEQARIWYLQADPVHDFEHVLRVLRMAERLQAVEGGDLEIIRAAALLHDVEGSAAGSQGDRANHHHTSADFAKDVLIMDGWPLNRIELVLHCIRSHRFRDDREPPVTIEAQILFDADKLDVLGAFGVARTIAYAVLDGEPVFAEPSELFLRTGKCEIEERHSSYHEYLFKLRRVKDRLFTQTARAIAADRHDYLVEFYQRLAAEHRGEK